MYALAKQIYDDMLEYWEGQSLFELEAKKNSLLDWNSF